MDNEQFENLKEEILEALSVVTNDFEREMRLVFNKYDANVEEVIIEIEVDDIINDFNLKYNSFINQINNAIFVSDESLIEFEQILNLGRLELEAIQSEIESTEIEYDLDCFLVNMTIEDAIEIIDDKILDLKYAGGYSGARLKAASKVTSKIDVAMPYYEPIEKELPNYSSEMESDGTSQTILTATGEEFIINENHTETKSFDNEKFSGNTESGTFKSSKNPSVNNSLKKSRLIYQLLIIFLGILGIHHFYNRKYVMGVIYLFTFGVFSFGVIYDFVKSLKLDKYYNCEDL